MHACGGGCSDVLGKSFRLPVPYGQVSLPVTLLPFVLWNLEGCHREVHIELYCDVHVLETCNQLFLHTRCCEINSLPLRPEFECIPPWEWSEDAFMKNHDFSGDRERWDALTFITDGPWLHSVAH